VKDIRRCDRVYQTEYTYPQWGGRRGRKCNSCWRSLLPISSAGALVETAGGEKLIYSCSISNKKKKNINPKEQQPKEEKDGKEDIMEPVWDRHRNGARTPR